MQRKWRINLGVPIKTKKGLRVLWNIVSTIIVAVIALAAVLLVGVRIVGLTPYAVISGSMEPAYRVGSLIYVRENEPGDIQVGDPITFVLNQDLVVATHRVIRIDDENRLFYTKGDNNDAPDAEPVRFENLLGKPVFTIPYLGYVSAYIQTPAGRSLSIAAVAAALLLVFLPDIIRVLKGSGGKSAHKKARSGDEIAEDHDAAGQDKV